MKIKYETTRSTRLHCITPCPFGEKYKEKVILVGTGLCMDCKHYKGIDTKSKQVICSKED